MAKPPKSSSTRKVAKMARSGGPVREAPKLGFPAAVFIIVLLGTLLVVYARGERDVAVAEPPTLGDHWHQAFGVYVCDTWLPPLNDVGPDVAGIHSHGDGLIHTHPFSESVTGEKATLGPFFEQVGITVDGDSFTMPDGTTYGPDHDCGGEAAQVEVVRWSGPDQPVAETVTTDLSGVRLLADGEVLALAVVPAGTEVPQPPSVANLANPIDEEPGAPPPVPEDPAVQGEPSEAVDPSAASTTAPPSAGADPAAP